MKGATNKRFVPKLVHEAEIYIVQNFIYEDGSINEI
jgi:hypothetical protein